MTAVWFGANSKGNFFIFDLFKNRISQLKKEISKKDKIVIFLTEKLSVKNAFTTNASAKPKSRKKKCEQQSPQWQYWIWNT